MLQDTHCLTAPGTGVAVDIQGRIFIFHNRFRFVNGLQRKIFAAGDVTLPVFLGRTDIQQQSTLLPSEFVHALIDVRLFAKIEETHKPYLLLFLYFHYSRRKEIFP